MATKGFGSGEALEVLGDLFSKLGREALAIRQSGRMEQSLKGFIKSGAKDLVTRADTLIEERIHQCLRTHWPDHGIRGEEGAEERSSSGYEWLIDPIDGTAGYAAGMDYFSISAGLTLNGVPELGLIFFPARGVFAHARRGRGAFINRERIVTSRGGDLANELFVSIGAVENPAIAQKVQSRGCFLLEVHSFTGTTLLLVEGKIGAYVHGGATPFDLGAAELLALEAGCMVSRWDGSTVEYKQKKIPVILARNREIWVELMSICGS